MEAEFQSAMQASGRRHAAAGMDVEHVDAAPAAHEHAFQGGIGSHAMPSAALEPIDLAIEHHQAGRLAEAERGYRDILRRNPHDRDALHLLGAVAHQAGHQDEAIRLIQQAILVDASNAKFHNSLGSVYQAIGHTAAAVACYRQSVSLDGGYPEGHANLGSALLEFRQPEEAMRMLERAVSLKPDYANAHLNLGLALKTVGRFGEATAAIRRALELRPGFWEALFQLGNLFKDQGRIEEAIREFEHALTFEPLAYNTWCNLLCNLQYRDGITPAELATAHARFDRTYGEPARQHLQAHGNDRSPDRPLRIGFVSPDLRSHPVGFFMVRLLEHIDRMQAVSICYHLAANSDHITERMRVAAPVWRDAHGWNDDQLVRAIRDDAVDILFDLSGHTRDNRLLVFARKPAPIQITWAGYVGTTGLRTMDYLLADRHQVPEDAEPHYVERILRMPDGYVTYDPPAAAPPVSPLPALQTGRVTFGSFNNQAKLQQGTIETWSRILQRVPGSRLMLKYFALSNPAIVERLREAFARHGITADRLVFLGSSSHLQQLEQYREVDIGLDPFPYSGGLTTLEALWMGVPVVTCPGETFAGRHSLSHLSNAGLTTMVARDLDDYVSIAAALAADLPALAKLRAGLREQVASSPLCDGERFARHFERLMRTAWKKWCDRAAESPPRQAIDSESAPQAATARESGLSPPDLAVERSDEPSEAVEAVA